MTYLTPTKREIKDGGSRPFSLKFKDAPEPGSILQRHWPDQDWPPIGHVGDRVLDSIAARTTDEAA